MHDTKGLLRLLLASLKHLRRSIASNRGCRLLQASVIRNSFREFQSSRRVEAPLTTPKFDHTPRSQWRVITWDGLDCKCSSSGCLTAEHVLRPYAFCKTMKKLGGQACGCSAQFWPQQSLSEVAKMPLSSASWGETFDERIKACGFFWGGSANLAAKAGSLHEITASGWLLLSFKSLWNLHNAPSSNEHYPALIRVGKLFLKPQICMSNHSTAFQWTITLSSSTFTASPSAWLKGTRGCHSSNLPLWSRIRSLLWWIPDIFAPLAPVKRALCYLFQFPQKAASHQHSSIKWSCKCWSNLQCRPWWSPNLTWQPSLMSFARSQHCLLILAT